MATLTQRCPDCGAPVTVNVTLGPVDEDDNGNVYMDVTIDRAPIYEHYLTSEAHEQQETHQ